MIYLKFEQFLLNLIIDLINRWLIVYEKFDAIYQKTNQKISNFKIYLKKIKIKIFSFNKYHKIRLFLTKLISVLKIKSFIIKDMFDIRKTILFKSIMQKTILSCTHDNNNYIHF